MDKNVFISKVEIYDIKKDVTENARNHQVSICFFDKNGQESVLLSSIMTNDNANKYKQNLLNLLDCRNWTEVKYNAMPLNLTTILDEEDNSRIIGLESKKGLILKNEIKFYF